MTDYKRLKMSLDSIKGTKGKPPDVVIDERAKELVRDKKISYTSATREVLRNDPELARAWIHRDHEGQTKVDTAPNGQRPDEILSERIAKLTKKGFTHDEAKALVFKNDPELAKQYSAQFRK